MEKLKAIQRAILLNKVMVAVTIIFFIIFRVIKYNNDMRIIILVPVAYCVVTFVVLIFVIISYAKLGQYDVKGRNSMLAAALISFGFTIIGYGLGIITFILTAASLKGLNEAEKLEKFSTSISQVELNI